MAEEYACEKQPDDGEIYYRIRHYQNTGEPYFEQRWLARLEAIGKRKKQDMSRVIKHPQYRSAFDCQLEMPGLASGMNLGTLSHMFAMKFDEVSTCACCVGFG